MFRLFRLHVPIWAPNWKNYLLPLIIFQKYLGLILRLLSYFRISAFVFNNRGKLKTLSLNPRYSPDELRYLPLNTALYEPPLDPELPALESDGDSDDAEDGRGDEKRKNKGTSVRTFVYSRRCFLSLWCWLLPSNVFHSLWPLLGKC